jgi:cold-inducible RNA-binding protein
MPEAGPVHREPSSPSGRVPSFFRVLAVLRAEGGKEVLMAVKLFIGSLSFSTSSDRLREAFARIGTVESASVVTDRDTGRSRGFGFVEMATTEEANDAVARLNGTELDGRRIKVELAKPGGGAGGGGGGQRRGGGGGGWGGGRR